MQIVFWYILKFLFPQKKKCKYYPNKNSTKTIKERQKTLSWEIEKAQYQNTYLKKEKKRIMIEDLNILGLIILIIIIVTKIMIQSRL